MDSHKYLVVVTVHEGRNFELPDGYGAEKNQVDKYVAYLEARFNGEILVSDPIELTCLNPQFNTELAWELDRKSLHLFRIERAPIKLQCFVENVTTRQKKLVGYSIMDLRSAQSNDEPAFEWKLLLNSKYTGLAQKRPELFYALQLQKFDSDRAGNESIGFQSDAKEDESQDCLSSLDIYNFDKDLRVKLADGYHKIWDAKSGKSEDDCRKFYNIGIVIASAANLNKLIRYPAKLDHPPQYNFRFSLFGSAFNTYNAFTDLVEPDIPPEKISFKVATTDLPTLKIYFELNPTLEVQLCDSNRMVIGFITLSLNGLIDESNIIGEFKVSTVVLAGLFQTPFYDCNLNTIY